ncbi:carbohydrate sulfotransferase 8-like [Cheilinus undulatus]|uniref:carbohydrate sulfotransferase 8-like n=1 Tax=Cheilinus undulatus TaxID=241271 RepID=UPI001BD4958D|nr:carbohydrate sulfotransferase 8-like [Cheilinus undulatus]
MRYWVEIPVRAQPLRCVSTDSENGAVDRGMKRPWLLLCFLFLLGAVSLLLLFHMKTLNDIIRHLRPAGLKIRLAAEKEESDHQPAGIQSLVLSLMNDSSTPPVTEPRGNTSAFNITPAEEEEELQQQMAVQEHRRRHLTKVCSEFFPGSWKKAVKTKHIIRILVEERFRILYCIVPKAGCSNWKRVLMVLAGKETSVLDISHKRAHFHNNLKGLKAYSSREVREKLKTFNKVLFVREPFQRLVSAYRDKFENPETHYHRHFGRSIIARYRANPSREALSTGDGVTFREFVHYLLDSSRPVGRDVHWEPISSLCHPCVVHYDFIGRFENMNNEANILLRSMGAPPTVRYPDYKDRNPHDERTSTIIARKYFSQLNATEIQAVYEFYRMDYLMFDYPKPFPDLV